MSTVKLGLAELTIEEKIQLATNIEVALTGNPSFTTPDPTLASLRATADNLGNKTAAAADIRAQSQIATITQDDAEDQLDAALTTLASYVESTSKGDEAKILSAGMQVKAAAIPTGPLPAPGSVAATVGDGAGEVDLAWPKLAGSKSYVIQYATDPNAPDDDWKFSTTCTKSSATVSSLIPGTRYWFRIAATGSAGQSPWSSPVTARAV